MANRYLPLTKNGSVVTDAATFEHHSKLYPNSDTGKPGYYDDVETVLSLDTSGYLYIPIPIGLIPAYGQISLSLNVTGTNIAGGPYGGFSGIAIMQGSINNDSWTNLATGSLLLSATLGDAPKASSWEIDMVAGPFAQKTTGRWPYLRLRLNYNPAVADNSANFIKCILTGHR